MNQLSLEDSPSPSSLREAGISRVIDHNKQFIHRLRTVARRICAEKGTVCTDDLREWARDNGVIEPHFKAWSGVLKGREWIFVEWTESRWPSNHGRRVAVYRHSNGVEA